MLVADDDDDIREEVEAEQQLEAELAAAEPTDASSEPGDESVDPATVTLDDVSLLPYVAALVQAHRSNGSKATKMTDLRRAVRHADASMAALQHAVSGPAADPAAAEALLRAREDLLARASKRAKR